MQSLPLSRPRGTARRSLNISASDENVNPTTGEDVSNRENEVPSSRLTATKKRAMLEAVVSRKRILADRSNQAASTSNALRSRIGEVVLPPRRLVNLGLNRPPLATRAVSSITENNNARRLQRSIPEVVVPPVTNPVVADQEPVKAEANVPIPTTRNPAEVDSLPAQVNFSQNRPPLATHAIRSIIQNNAKRLQRSVPVVVVPPVTNPVVVDQELVQPEETTTLRTTNTTVEVESAPVPAPAQVQAQAPVQETNKVGWEELDAEDADDPLMVAEYVDEIFDYMKEIEVSSMPAPNYMSRQKELKWSMRSIVNDWMIEVHGRFHMLPETLFLAINIVDRFLSIRVVSMNRLQLVGMTALLIASKYEEIMTPTVQNFIYTSDGGYTADDLLNAERYMLTALRFELNFPNPLHFLRRISKADNYCIRSRTIAKYLMEIPIIDHRFITYRPSILAAASMWMSRRLLSRGPWDENFVHYSGYTEEELLPLCILLQDHLVADEIKYDSLFKKYEQKRFLQASRYVREKLLRQPIFSADGTLA